MTHRGCGPDSDGIEYLILIAGQHKLLHMDCARSFDRTVMPERDQYTLCKAGQAGADP